MSNLNINTNNAVALNNNTATMTSQEIANLVQSRHDNVKRTIERLVESSVIQLPPLEEVKNHLGQTVVNYIFSGEQGKRDTTIIVAQLSPQFTGQLVDRWMELEKQIIELVKPSYMIEDPIQRAKKWIEEATAKQETEAKLIETQKIVEIQTPKAEVFDAVLDKERTYTIREFAQRTGVKEKVVKAWIIEKRWATGASAKTFKPASWSNSHNYMRMIRTGKPFITSYGTTCYNESIVFTQEGFNEAVRKMVKSGIMQPLVE